MHFTGEIQICSIFTNQVKIMFIFIFNTNSKEKNVWDAYVAPTHLNVSGIL